jgi:hypothetical protein
LSSILIYCFGSNNFSCPILQLESGCLWSVDKIFLSADVCFALLVLVFIWSFERILRWFLIFLTIFRWTSIFSLNGGDYFLLQFCLPRTCWFATSFLWVIGRQWTFFLIADLTEWSDSLSTFEFFEDKFSWFVSHLCKKIFGVSSCLLVFS